MQVERMNRVELLLPGADVVDAVRVFNEVLGGHLTEPEDLEAMLDGITEARRIALSDAVAAICTGAELSPGPQVAHDDRLALAAWASRTVSTFHHPVGTCAMGADPELGAVTDAHGSVGGRTASRGSCARGL